VWRTQQEGTYPYNVQRVQHLEPLDHAQRLELYNCINADLQLNRYILLSDEVQFTRYVNPHGTVESRFQHQLSINAWGGMLHIQTIGPFILEGSLTYDIYV
jgi:hypothetical protein